MILCEGICGGIRLFTWVAVGAECVDDLCVVCVCACVCVRVCAACFYVRICAGCVFVTAPDGKDNLQNYGWARVSKRITNLQILCLGGVVHTRGIKL